MPCETPTRQPFRTLTHVSVTSLGENWSGKYTYISAFSSPQWKKIHTLEISPSVLLFAIPRETHLSIRRRLTSLTVCLPLASADNYLVRHVERVPARGPAPGQRGHHQVGVLRGLFYVVHKHGSNVVLSCVAYVSLGDESVWLRFLECH